MVIAPACTPPRHPQWPSSQLRLQRRCALPAQLGARARPGRDSQDGVSQQQEAAPLFLPQLDRLHEANMCSFRVARHFLCATFHNFIVVSELHVTSVASSPKSTQSLTQSECDSKQRSELARGLPVLQQRAVASLPAEKRSSPLRLSAKEFIPERCLPCSCLRTYETER